MDEKGKFMYGVMLVLLSASFFLNDVYFPFQGFDVGYTYIGGLIIIVIGFFSFLAAPDVPAYIGCVKLSGILMLQVIVSLIFSMLIYLFHFTELRQMISGSFVCVYVLIGIGTAGSLSYLLKEKAASCMFWAVAVAFFLRAVEQVRLVGAGEFFRQFYTLLSSFADETGSAMGALESLSFDRAFAMLLLYFIIFRKREKGIRFWARVSFAVLGMALGLKRGGVAALLMAFLACMFYRWLPPRFRKSYVILLTVALTAYALCIVPAIRYGVLERVMGYLHIDTSGRIRIYNEYAAYYEISPFYMGKGFGWVNDFLRSMADKAGFSWVTGTHDEYLRSYIELGFWGYLLWVLSTFPFIIGRLVKVSDRDGSEAVIGCIIFMAVTYTFSNIYSHVVTVMAFSLVIMTSYRFGRERSAGAVESK